MMSMQVQVGDMAVDIERKNIRHLYLRLHFPTGRVRVSAPARMGLEAIRSFVIARQGWVRLRLQKFHQRQQLHPPAPPDEAVRYVWGEAHRLVIVEGPGRPAVRHEPGQLLLKVKPGAGKAGQRAVLERWYRHQLKQRLPPLLERWQGVMGVRVAVWGVRKMTTRWGTCNPAARRIWLNLELARRSPACLEFIVVHELAHLLERRHNARFRAIMDRYLPSWRQYKADLAAMPLMRESC